MIKIPVVNNSALMRSDLRDIINSDKAFPVIDMSQNGEEAYNKIKETKFDLVETGPKFSGKPELIALACSTGGPNALHTMLPMLPKNLSVPLVIVQHMPPGFTAALAERLNQICAVAVKEAEDGEILRPGCVYIAPGGRHMEIKECGKHKACISLNDLPPINNLRPCADLMYKSLVKTSYQNILCVVLTGMGSDATKGILELKKHKNLYIITESKETCVVYGMPKSIVQRKLADETVPIYKVSDAIIKRTGD